MVTTSNVDDNNMLHVHYVLPSNFSCLISFRRSHSVKLHGVKISIVLRMEEETDRKRWEGHGEQSQARDQLSRLPCPYSVDGTVGKNHRTILVLYFPFSAHRHLPTQKHGCPAFLPGEIGLKCTRGPFEEEKKSQKHNTQDKHFSFGFIFPPFSLFIFLLLIHSCPWVHSLLSCRSRSAHRHMFFQPKGGLNSAPGPLLGSYLQGTHFHLASQ